MNFSIRFSTIKQMLKLCKKLNDGCIKRNEIEELLSHEDYKFEFSRYGNRVLKEEFVDYFLNLPILKEEDITNIDLKIHHKYYINLLNNIDLYLDELKELEACLTPTLFENQIQIALKGLPDNIVLPPLNFIFTIGIGQSFGYAHENGTHFDFLQLVKNYSASEFCSVISHEIHHIGVNVIHDNIDLDSIPMEELFYLYFSSEGLAVKYCNNAEGILSKSIYDGEKNIGLDKFTWKYLNDDFYNTMIHFKKTIEDIRRNKIASAKDLQNEMDRYWMNPYTEDQVESDIPKLKHFRLYSFGNEIFGIIHDCFGKEKVFETLINLKDFPKVFNSALEQLGHKDFKI